MLDVAMLVNGEITCRDVRWWDVVGCYEMLVVMFVVGMLWDVSFDVSCSLRGIREALADRPSKLSMPLPKITSAGKTARRKTYIEKKPREKL